MPYTLDSKSWPIVSLTLEGTLTIEQMERLFADFEAIYARRERFATLVDASQLKLDRGLSQPFGHWVKRTIDDVRTFGMGSAIINDSPLLRFLMSAMFLIQPLPHPYIVVASREEAEAWIQELLRGHGLWHDSTEAAQDDVGT